jgi:hypothetical protein
MFYFELALATGAGLPTMMWLFESVINGLIEIGKTDNNATTSPDWYRYIHIILFVNILFFFLIYL